MRPLLILVLRTLDLCHAAGQEIAQACGWCYYRARNWIVRRLAK